MRAVPDTVVRPLYVLQPDRPAPRAPRPVRNDPETIALIRRACDAASEVLAEIEPHVSPGVTTDELDEIGHEAIVRRGGYPSPLGYLGYPRSICTAVNEVICHGIPGPQTLVDGDIVGVDVTVFLDGVHGDLCKTLPVGEVDALSAGLLDAGRRALAAGMSAVEPGRPVNAIGRAIEKEVRGRFGIVREFVGHEIGRDFHGALIVPHAFEASARTTLEEGMVFTIEPMVALGSGRARIRSDGWTAVTRDGSRSAQFEHTVLVTADGCEALTRW
ncbi:MAG: methionyl aminopeptidase [Gaiellaceae bacterium]|nr:methionyl aminopeptidase [Gaiellaceae bacterium]